MAVTRIADHWLLPLKAAGVTVDPVLAKHMQHAVGIYCINLIIDYTDMLLRHYCQIDPSEMRPPVLYHFLKGN